MPASGFFPVTFAALFQPLFAENDSPRIALLLPPLSRSMYPQEKLVSSIRSTRQNSPFPRSLTSRGRVERILPAGGGMRSSGPDKLVKAQRYPDCRRSFLRRSRSTSIPVSLRRERQIDRSISGLPLVPNSVRVDRSEPCIDHNFLRRFLTSQECVPSALARRPMRGACNARCAQVVGEQERQVPGFCSTRSLRFPPGVTPTKGLCQRSVHRPA